MGIKSSRQRVAKEPMAKAALATRRLGKAGGIEKPALAARDLGEGGGTVEPVLFAENPERGRNKKANASNSFVVVLI